MINIPKLESNKPTSLLGSLFTSRISANSPTLPLYHSSHPAETSHDTDSASSATGDSNSDAFQPHHHHSISSSLFSSFPTFSLSKSYPNPHYERLSSPHRTSQHPRKQLPLSIPFCHMRIPIISCISLLIFVALAFMVVNSIWLFWIESRHLINPNDHLEVLPGNQNLANQGMGEAASNVVGQPDLLHSVQDSSSKGSLNSSPPLSPASSSFSPSAENKLSNLQSPSSFLSEMTHLIIVAGHAVFKGHNYNVMDQEDDWWLFTYQKGQLDTLMGHLRLGIRLLLENPKSLLIFSGGQTRKEAGYRSEAFSYWMYSLTHDYLPPGEEQRVQLEEYATDSYQNLLFSICRFQELTGRYPENITVVSFGFKRQRFVDLHRAAVQFPSNSFRFYGLDPPFTFVEVRPSVAKSMIIGHPEKTIIMEEGEMEKDVAEMMTNFGRLPNEMLDSTNSNGTETSTEKQEADEETGADNGTKQDNNAQQINQDIPNQTIEKKRREAASEEKVISFLPEVTLASAFKGRASRKLRQLQEPQPLEVNINDIVSTGKTKEEKQQMLQSFLDAPGENVHGDSKLIESSSSPFPNPVSVAFRDGNANTEIASNAGDDKNIPQALVQQEETLEVNSLPDESSPGGRRRLTSVSESSKNVNHFIMDEDVPTLQSNVVGWEELSSFQQVSSEYDDAYADFKHDLYGCQDTLQSKKASRNPFRKRVGYGYGDSCPEMHSLIDICFLMENPTMEVEDTTTQIGPLPWNYSP